mmetsp:Transcript_90078/g.291030  ORF Transcript_90078/g.291030 Transcript_90078/m.291030 type:complete len:322 (-) Transcript_90078:855-1820(-)
MQGLLRWPLWRRRREHAPSWPRHWWLHWSLRLHGLRLRLLRPRLLLWLRLRPRQRLRPRLRLRRTLLQLQLRLRLRLRPRLQLRLRLWLLWSCVWPWLRLQLLRSRLLRRRRRPLLLVGALRNGVCERLWPGLRLWLLWPLKLWWRRWPLRLRVFVRGLRDGVCQSLCLNRRCCSLRRSCQQPDRLYLLFRLRGICPLHCLRHLCRHGRMGRTHQLRLRLGSCRRWHRCRLWMLRRPKVVCMSQATGRPLQTRRRRGLWWDRCSGNRLLRLRTRRSQSCRWRVRRWPRRHRKSPGRSRRRSRPRSRLGDGAGGGSSAGGGR